MTEAGISGNIAGRIYRILHAASKQPDGHPTRNVWAKALQCHPDDTPLIYGRLLLLRFALDRIEEESKHAQLRSRGLLVRHFDNIRGVLSPNHLNEDWGRYGKLLRNGELVALEVLANELPTEEEISKEELEEIGKLVAELDAAIRESQLDLAVRLWILDLLEGVRRSLHEYDIRGADGLRSAISSIIGELARHAEEWKPKENEWWVKELWRIVESTDEKIEKALKSHSLKLTYRVAKTVLGLPNLTVSTN